MGASTIEKEQFGETLKGLNMSEEEVNKFENAFKDPKFMEMFAEYAKEISDPKNRAETDEYLRQLEFENRVEEVYGKGVELIIPEPGFVVKTQNKTDRRKVFINVCHSEKVDPCKGNKTADPKHPGRTGTSWQIPLSLGKPKQGKDRKGAPCDVYDFVVHPITKEMAVRDARFRGLVVETAMENIEKNFSPKLDRSWTQPKMTYKGVEGAEQPHAMAIRGKDAPPSVDGRIAPRADSRKSEAERVAGREVKLAEEVGTAAASKSGESGGEAAGGGDGEGGRRSGFSFPEPKRKVREVKPTEPGHIGYEYGNGEVCPQYQIVECGSADLSSAWGDAGRGIDVGANIPREIVLRVELPGCTSAAGMELELEQRSLSLCIPGRFRLEKRLSHAVDDDRAKAKFDKSRARLEVTLPVVPPPAPSQPPLMQVVSSRPVAEVVPTTTAVVSPPDSETEFAAPEVLSPVSAAVERERSMSGDSGDESDWVSSPVELEMAEPIEGAEEKQNQAEGMSEMQKMWAEWKAKADEAVVAASSPAATVGPAPPDALPSQTDAVVDDAHIEFPAATDFIASASFRGARAGMLFQMGPKGLGYYLDPVAASVIADSIGNGSTESGSNTTQNSKSRAAAALAGAGLLSTPAAAAAALPSAAVPNNAAAPRLKPRINQSLAEELD